MANMRTKSISELIQFVDGTIGAVIAQHVATRPENPAIVMSRDSFVSYGALGKQIAAFGEALRISGVGSSAKVAIMLPGDCELAIAIVATACHSAAVPLNPRLTANELDDLFATLSIDAVVIPDGLDCAVREVAARHGARLLEVRCSKPGRFEFSSSIAAISPLAGSVALGETVQPDAPAIILRTSASTGKPKLVPFTHRNLTITSEKRKAWFNFTPHDRAICVNPLYYGQALKGILFTPLLLGGSVIFPDRSADGDIFSWLVDLQPTWLDASPAFHMNLLERARARRETPLRHCLRFIRSGAAPLPAAVRQGLEEVFGVPVLEGYGLTETGTVAANSIVPERRKLGTMGKPSPDEVAIRGEDGRLLPSDSIGEIVVRGAGVMPGYLHNEEANRAAFVDGWFRTGDLGSIDPEGFLTHLGRLKVFINRGGEKITPFEIERALFRHPSVIDAAAFAVPHPRLGENVAAAVVLAPGATTTSKDIKEFLFEHLAAFKIPQRVDIMPELPKGPTGKTLRPKLSEMAANRIRDVVHPGTPLQSQILEIWQRMLGRADIGVDENFFEAGGDSLLAVQMVCEIEAITGQQIPPSALRSAYTVRELAAAVVRRMPTTPELVTRAKDGSGTPFLFCHGDYTTRGFYALKLADMLTGNEPVYLVHPHQDDTKLTIEEMARVYLPHVLAVQPTGAIRVGGYCNGGLLAWELASQLDRMGREVEAVVLIETISLNARLVLRAIAKLLGTIGTIAPKRIGEKASANGMWALRRLGKRMKAIWHTANWHVDIFGPYSRVMSKYVPPPIVTRVLCVVCDHNRASTSYSSKPWINLAPVVQSKIVAGTHVTCITKHVSEVARSIDEFFGMTSGSIGVDKRDTTPRRPIPMRGR
jgi:acyl-CoA synthetase (AMP-forming)/AMP-acid ligase II/thioesterase domain-containing protein/acyl carrier protein